MADVEFRLLGPLEVLAGGTIHEITSGRQQIVLCTLLLNADRAVPFAPLVDAVWNESPPATARSQLQTCISGLRRQLAEIHAESEIVTRPMGYMMMVRGDVLDIQEFEHLVGKGRVEAAGGRTEEAVQDLRAALTLWRGPAAAGVESALVQAIATRLNENRIGVLEECIDLELALGRHRGLTGELGELVRQYPMREKLRAQHMLCLYRSARPADALESFRQARQILREELGLDPGEDLRSLERAILANDKTLDLEPAVHSGSFWADRNGPTVPCQLPAAIADFTGRLDVQHELIDLLSAGPDDEGTRYLPVVALTGKGGVGKTALALQVAHAVRSHYPDGQLFAELTGPDGQPVSIRVLLGQFLRALGLPPTSLPTELAERIATYRTALGDCRVLIVLDNASSVAQVMQLIPGCPNCAVVITSRYRLWGLPGVHDVEVRDLDEQASVDLLAKIIGRDRVQAEEASALAIVRLCGCLPLALRIVAAKLATRTHWRLEQMVRRMTDDERRLDELALGGVGIRATLMLSCNGLSLSARRLLRRLSLLGTADFAAWVSGPLLDVDAGVAGDLLDTLIEARLVEVWVTQGGSPRFRLHDLVRIYAQEQIAAEEPIEERLAALQRLVRCWLTLASEAHRRSYGGDFATLHSSAAAWELPEELVNELLDNPMGWFRAERAGLVSAILQAGQAGFADLCWDLALTSVTLFESEHRVDDWRRTHEAALEVTRRTANLRGEAAVLYSLGNLAVSVNPGEAIRHLESALQIFNRIGDAHGRALALGLLAYAHRHGGRYDMALLHYMEALEESRAVGDLVGQVDALTGMAQIHMGRDRLEDAEEYLNQARGICRSLKAPRVAAQTEHRLGEFFLRKGNLDWAELTFRSALDLVRHERDRVGEIYALVGLGTVHARRDWCDLAESDLLAALKLSRQLGDNLAHGRVLLALADLYLARHAPEQAVPLLNETLVVFKDVVPAGALRDQFLRLRARLDDQIGFLRESVGGVVAPAARAASPERPPAAAVPTATQVGPAQPQGGPGSCGPAEPMAAT
jgi:DNA-binding SARP family transcriptional activator